MCLFQKTENVSSEIVCYNLGYKLPQCGQAPSVDENWSISSIFIVYLNTVAAVSESVDAATAAVMLADFSTSPRPQGCQLAEDRLMAISLADILQCRQPSGLSDTGVGFFINHWNGL